MIANPIAHRGPQMSGRGDPRVISALLLVVAQLFAVGQASATGNGASSTQNTAPPVRIEGTVSGADHTMHGLVIAEEDGFYAAAGTNITCDRTTFERLTNDWNNRYRGLVKGSWGFMQCVARYGWSQMHRCTGGNAARTERHRQMQTRRTI